MIELTDNNVDILCKLTVQQACHDLIEAICKKDRGRIEELKHFFKSTYYSNMTKINDDYMIRMCYQVAKDANFEWRKVPARYKKLV